VKRLATPAHHRAHQSSGRARPSSYRRWWCCQRRRGAARPHVCEGGECFLIHRARCVREGGIPERPRSPPPATLRCAMAYRWPPWALRNIVPSPVIAHSRPTQGQRGACFCSGSAVHVYLGTSRQMRPPEEARQSNVWLPVLETVLLPGRVPKCRRLQN
jgi:hypothetical protein